MKSFLLNEHRQAIRDGAYNLAKVIYRALSQRARSIHINDGNSEAWETGFANRLMEQTKWHNSRLGFTANINLQ